MSIKHSIRRARRGHAVAEVGPTLWLTFSILFFPMLTFGTIGVRYALFLNAARLATIAAAQTRSFQANVSGEMSAVNTAQQIATYSASGFSGINLSAIDTFIVVAPLSGGSTTLQSTPLAQPADTNRFSYDIEVRLQAQLSPLFGSAGFLKIPGLTAPMIICCKCDRVSENTQGLTQ